MAVKKKSLSEFNTDTIPSAENMKFGVVVSEWNTEVTEELSKGVYEVLTAKGAKEENIFKKYVPGSFELPLGAQFIAGNSKVNAIVCVGCVIQGETRHFEFISNAVSKGIMDVNLKYNVPVIFCVLTTDNIQQALDRSGGKHGNKGVEAGIAAIKMAKLGLELRT